MKVHVTIGDIVTLGYQHYSEYDIIVRCLKEMDLLEEIERVRTELGILTAPFEDSLPDIAAALHQQGIVELILPKATLYWDGTTSNLNGVHIDQPFLHTQTLLAIEKLTPGA